MNSVGPRERPQDPSCEGTSPPLVNAARMGMFGATDERQTQGETASTDGLIKSLKRNATPTDLRAARAALEKKDG